MGLKSEEVEVSALDNLNQELRSKIFKDKVQEQKDDAASLEALKKGDKVTAKKLADDKLLLASEEAKINEELKQVVAQEAKEVAAERALQAKIIQEKKVLARNEESD